MPHTVLSLMAAGAVVTAAVLGEAWRGEPAILSHAAKAAADLTSCVGANPAGRRRNAKDGGTSIGATADRSHAQLRYRPGSGRMAAA